ncbi:hypothetical protein JOD21_002161 [Jeotgalibacillus terrae]|nr:hypothetical protein [Jeotgalibacillus terrae]
MNRISRAGYIFTALHTLFFLNLTFDFIVFY